MISVRPVAPAMSRALVWVASAQSISIAAGGTGGVCYPMGRRHRRGALEACCRPAGNGRDDGRLGRQAEG
jgi:hypothetical protein